MSLAIFATASVSFYCGLFFTIGDGFQRDLPAAWSLGLLFCAWLAASIGLKADSRGERARDGRLGLLFFFILSLALGLYRLDHFSIWLDEELQAHASMGPQSITRAASFTQMPLSYYFTALGISALGMNDWGLRIFPCLSVAGSAALFVSLMRYVTRERVLVSLGAFAYVLNPWVIRYSQEGRPYGCVLFCALLWAYCLRAYLERDAGSNASCLFATTILLGLSIAFQALLLILSLASVSAGVFLLLPAHRKRAGIVFCTQAAATILLLPLVLLCVSNSRQFLHSSPEFGGFGFLLRRFLENVRSLLQVWPPLCLLLFAGPLLAWRYGSGRRRQVADAELSAGVFGAVLLVFAISFCAAFSLLVQYELRERYLIVVVPFALLVLMSALSVLLSAISSGKVRWCALVCVAWALLAPELRALPYAFRGEHFARWNNDYRGMFRVLREKGRAGDRAYALLFQDPSDWEQVGFIAKEFYYEPADSVTLASRYDADIPGSPAELIRRDLRLTGAGAVFLAFFVTGPAGDWLRDPALLGPGDTLFSGDYYFLFRLDPRPGWKLSLDRFLTKLVAKARPQKFAYDIYDVLLLLAEDRHDRKACARWLGELAPFRRSAPRIQKIWQFHDEKCAEATN